MTVEHPSLGASAAEVWRAWAAYQPASGHIVEALIPAEGYFSLSHRGDLSRLTHRYNSRGCALSYTRPATPSEVQLVDRAILGGTIEIYEIRARGCLGLQSSGGDAGKIRCIIHAATGRILPEYGEEQP